MKGFFSQYGFQLLGILGTLIGLLGSAVAAWAYRYKKRADVDAQIETAPLQTLERVLADRDKELAEARQQLFTMMSNHLAHDKLEREQMVVVLTQLKDAVLAAQGVSEKIMGVLSEIHLDLARALGGKS